MSLNIRITTIDHKSQRYETIGDWFYTSGNNLNIRVSNLGDWRKELLVAIHELIEEALCHERGIPQDIVDAFDKDFEKNRKEGDTSEPGDAKGSPYRKEHFFATTIERAIALELKVDWLGYEEIINSL